MTADIQFSLMERTEQDIQLEEESIGALIQLKGEEAMEELTEGKSTPSKFRNVVLKFQFCYCLMFQFCHCSFICVIVFVWVCKRGVIEIPTLLSQGMNAWGCTFDGCLHVQHCVFAPKHFVHPNLLVFVVERHSSCVCGGIGTSLPDGFLVDFWLD